MIMLIKRNVYFSAVDQETGEEKLFSVNEILTENEYLERVFSDKPEEKKSKSTKKGLAAIAAAGTTATGAGIAISNKNISKKAKEEMRDSIKLADFLEDGRIKSSKTYIPKKEEVLKRFKSTTNPIKEEKGYVAGVGYKINKKNAETFDYEGFEKKVEKSIKDMYSSKKNTTKRGIRRGAKAMAKKNAAIIAGSGLLATGAAAGLYAKKNKKK